MARIWLRVIPLPVDAEGAVLDGLDDAAVMLTPAHQFPLGVTLAPERRLAAVRWAAERGGLVIEDDYDGEFRYDRQPVGAMQALAPEHVVYAGTASKSLAPGLRLGWLVLPTGLVDEVVAAKERSGALNGTLEQLALAELIESGAYDRQVRRARLAYRRRRDHLVATLRARAPEVRVAGIAAGLHVLLRLAERQQEAAVVVAAGASRGLVLEGLGSFAAADCAREPPALVVGYARPPEHAFTGALARLAEVLESTP